MVEALKSLVLSLALTGGHLDVERTVELATLEQRFQTSTWGRVEWAHDVELAELRARAAAGALMVRLNQTVKHERMPPNDMV